MTDRALRAFDVNAREWREALEATVREASTVAGRKPVGAVRVAAITDAVLAVIAEHAEDLEPVLADLSRRSADARRSADQSAGRRAALEHALGIEPAIPGEVVSPPDPPRPVG